ncbi:MAG: hypothetical protein KBA51_10065 [Kiritimatiellae bacterium]|nr:hypothetical protein [Kiritimatiellia bacterium]
MKRTVLYVAAALLGLGLAGCSDDPNAPPIGPDISGEWSGTYQDPGGPVIPLSATIVQNGSDVFIMTSMSDVGRLMTGSMNADGYIFLQDANDGETWSAAHTPTSNRLELIDYAFGAGSALRRITLQK